MIKNLIRRPHKQLHAEPDSVDRVTRPEYAAPKKPRIVIEATKPFIKGAYYNGEPISIDSYKFVSKGSSGRFTFQFNSDSNPRFKDLPAWDYSLFEVVFV